VVARQSSHDDRTMAMLHPSDHFSSTEPLSHVLISSLFVHRLSLIPEAIASPSSSQGSYHKIYFVRLPTGEGLWAGREVVLRVARKAITCIKVENEVAMIELVRRAGVPAPEVMFYSSDISQTDNVLGYEYICQERISYPALSDTYNSLSPKALGNVISQLVDIFIKMFDLQLPGGGLYGSLRVCTDGNIGSGPVIEETMWQISDIKRYFTSEPYNLSSETFSTLNPTSSYPTYPAYVSAFLKTYHHVISIHPAVTFLVHLLGPLQKLIEKLDEAEENWVKRLRDEKGLRGRLWHKDFHFGNLLCDDEGNIRSVIDWEFAGIGVNLSLLFFLHISCSSQHPTLLPPDRTLSHLSQKDPPPCPMPSLTYESSPRHRPFSIHGLSSSPPFLNSVLLPSHQHGHTSQTKITC